jgi:SAM-dependent methyltransferase
VTPADVLPPLPRLAQALARPEPWAPHDAPFWDDPWIGRGMLAAHLDPGTDAASRRPATIEATVEHLVGALPLRAGDRLLDLGCGPGLYAASFARRGMMVTGIDLAVGSIEHARRTAAREHLPVDYRIADYTRDDLGGPFDAAVLIYLDVGVLAEDPLDRLLDGVRAALRPGGAFVFDVHGPGRRRPPDAGIETEWFEHGGFWRRGPHLVVTTTYRYGAVLDLAQHAVFEPDGTVTVYRVWDRAWSVPDLRARLGRHGFGVDTVWADLTGTEWTPRAVTTALVARRS